MSQGLDLAKGPSVHPQGSHDINKGYNPSYLESAPEMTETDHPTGTESSLQLKTSSTTCLSISQVWCDVFNFLVGVTCIINGSTEDGSSLEGIDIFFDRMRIWTGK